MMEIPNTDNRVWCAKYNPFHDQLVLSGGSDNLVNLWRVASVSSAPWLGAEDEDAARESEGDYGTAAGSAHQTAAGSAHQTAGESQSQSDPADIRVL